MHDNDECISFLKGTLAASYWDSPWNQIGADHVKLRHGISPPPALNVGESVLSLDLNRYPDRETALARFHEIAPGRGFHIVRDHVYYTGRKWYVVVRPTSSNFDFPRGETP